jgi:DtxR family Mn-dependent transcriptional regulator
MTQSQEDYLEMVSFLADEGWVRVTDIAARLGFSKPAVLTALRALEEKGLVTHEKYHPVALTASGIEKAAEIREKHTFLTDFLRNTIGVSAETAEKDACKIEHVLSRETMERLKQFSARMAAPANSPHGRT